MIRPNVYKDLTNICLSCGFPVINRRAGSKICSLPRHDNQKFTRSDCQKYDDYEKQKARRAKKQVQEQEEIAKFEHNRQSDSAWRECIGRLCVDLPDRYFWSSGRFNKQCDRCTHSTYEGGATVRIMKFGGGIVDEGFKRKFIPTMVSRSREV